MTAWDEQQMTDFVLERFRPTLNLVDITLERYLGISWYLWYLWLCGSPFTVGEVDYANTNTTRSQPSQPTPALLVPMEFITEPVSEILPVAPKSAPDQLQSMNPLLSLLSFTVSDIPVSVPESGIPQSVPKTAIPRVCSSD